MLWHIPKLTHITLPFPDAADPSPQRADLAVPANRVKPRALEWFVILNLAGYNAYAMTTQALETITEAFDAIRRLSLRGARRSVTVSQIKMNVLFV